MIVRQIVQPQWVAIPREIRTRMRNIFSIPMTGGSIVENDIVISDGTTNADLSVITQEKLEEFTKATGDFYELVDKTIETIKGELDKIIEVNPVEPLKPVDKKLIKAVCGVIDLYIEEDKVPMLKEYTITINANDKTKKSPKK
jgi:hypothetical protein